ncbi:MAG: L-threonylcarbamoyladenylate synthase [Kiritimatiellae bacterium]|nr:L-threonylcarbamoyladenylate synthase [Kiritimatiellia bacterium]
MPTIIPVDAESPDPAAVDCAAAALRAGGLVILPTDTVYGLAAHPGVPGAAERLFAAKARSKSKPVALLAADIGAVRRHGAVFGRRAEELARRYWPGPLTLVLKTDAGFEGYRVPDHAVTLAVLKAAGGMLRVTSANRSGGPPALTAPAAVRAVGPRADVVLDAGRVPGGQASTVVKVDGESLQVLREGVVPLAALSESA